MSQHVARPNFQQVIDQLGLMSALADFDPVVIGTPPSGMAVEGSDIDIACSAPDLGVFATHPRARFQHHHAFEIHEVQHLSEPAFAQLLGLKGDPYTAMLELEPLPDDDIKALYSRVGTK